MTYLGLTVLDADTHNMREAIAEAFGRIGSLVENPTGRRTFDDQSGQSFPTRSFTWLARTRAECVALRQFLDACQGRRNAFWVPTCCWDLPLAADAIHLSSELTIQKVGYVDALAGVAARSHIAAFPRGSAMELRSITGAAAIDATTERVSIGATPSVDWPMASTVISFLVVCRLAADMTTLRWYTRDVCEATITFQELPLEVPGD